MRGQSEICGVGRIGRLLEVEFGGEVFCYCCWLAMRMESAIVTVILQFVFVFVLWRSS